MQNFTSIFISISLISILFIHFENKRSDVNYVTSKVDNRKYLVQNHHDKQKAADNLATIRKNLVILVQELKKKNKGNIDIERMVNNFNPDNISESTKDNKYTSYSVNKGEKIVFCLRSRDERNNLVELNIMMFVALHELAHTMTKSIGHTPEFWNNFRVLLRNARNLGIYQRVNYDKKPVDYCGTKITNDPENYGDET
jgi:predicted metal-dependent hydrolase